MRLRLAVVGCSVALALVACHRAKHYTSNAEIMRSSVVHRDERGRPLTLDIELSYVDCPGTQIEVVRGGGAFATCASKYKVGDKVALHIDHERSDEGHWRALVRKIGECDRVVDPADEASYSVARECEDWKVNGASVGFQCTYVPEKRLVQKCPWFRRY